MRFARTLAGLVILALAAMPASAQHGGASPSHAAGGAHGGTYLGAPPFSGGVARSPSAAAPRPPSLAAPVAGVHAQPGHVFFAHPPISEPSATSRLALQNAPASVWGIASLRPGFASEAHRFLGRGFRGEQPRRFAHFPYFFFGGGQPVCSPLLPGYFGEAWFDRLFTCFGTSFYGVQFYPPGFLAPELAYEPWLEGPATSGPQDLSAVADDTLLAEDLGITADIAAAEAAESNPNQQITMLVLKEGISFAVVDYWVENGKLGYVTTYGRQNTIDLDRLDLNQTVKINSSRGIPFVLRERPAESTPPPSAPPQ